MTMYLVVYYYDELKTWCKVACLCKTMVSAMRMQKLLSEAYPERVYGIQRMDVLKPRGAY